MKVKLYLLVPLILLCLVFIAAEDHKPVLKHYNNGEVSFDYPEGWYEINGSKHGEILAISNKYTASNITINKQSIPEDYSLKEHYDNLKIGKTIDPNFQIISKRNLTINNMEAYEFIYKTYENGVLREQKEVWIEDDGVLFSIIRTTPERGFENIIKSDNLSNFMGDLEILAGKVNNQNLNELSLESPIDKFKNDQDFETIIESLSINSSRNAEDASRWAEISIPSIDSLWFIRSDTVNAYRSVYHYRKSVYPGENGKFGVMGHHTRFSAPFAKIDQLKPGDLVIIDDFLTLKTYTYEVVSNGDIKWDYKENPIEFEQNGDPTMILVTCYPPGRMDAAWIVNCKLVSIQPLD